MQDNTSTAGDITVTERAARRIGEILRREPAGAMLRVSVEGGGCSGFQYRFDIDRSRLADDVLIQCPTRLCWWIRCRSATWRAPRSISSMT